MRKFVEPQITVSHFSVESVVTTSAGALSPTTQAIKMLAEDQAAKVKVIKFTNLMQIEK